MAIELKKGQRTDIGLQRLGVEVLEVPADAMGASAVEAYLGIKRAGSV